MIVCLCEGLSEKALRAQVRQGACSRFELSRATGAGTHCGACKCDLKEIVRSELGALDNEATSPPVVVAK